MNENNLPALPSQFPTPPVDMVMPELANTIVTIANFSVLVIVAIFFLRTCSRLKTPLPILFLIGGAIGYLTEPFIDLMVLVWYPEIGTNSFLRLFNVSVPIWVLAPWSFYIGGQAWWVYKKFSEGMTIETLWKFFPLFWVTNVMIEIPALQFDLYTYYGPQAFKVFGFPLWMGFANACVPILTGGVVYLLRDYLVGPRIYLTPLFVPLCALTAQACVGWPMWFTLNSGASETATMIATIPALGFACLLISVIGYAACVPSVKSAKTASTDASTV